MNCNLEENFNHILNLCSQNLSHDELIKYLKNGTVAEKQIAALNLDKIQSQDEAFAFISNLTGCDGKIREAVASRLYEFLHTNQSLLSYPEIFADASIDINANISRLVINSISVFKNNTDFKKIYTKKLLSFIEEGFAEISKIKCKDKKYVLNKQLFKIYWSLEGLFVFSESIDEKILISVLEKALERPEYTIREKAAKILSKYANNNTFAKLYTQVINDENFYVRFAAVNKKE